ALSTSSGPACSKGPFGRGNWPPGCWRPYADASPFNTPLPPDPRLMDNSAQIVARVLGDIAAQHRVGNMHAPLDGTGGWPTYWGNESDPIYSVHCTDFGGGCSIEGVPFHGPAGAVIQGGPQAPPDTDRHLTVIDQTSGWEYDLWQVRIGTLPDGGGNF